MTVKTRIIQVNPKIIEQDKIKIIAGVLKEAGVIIYPTDTFYGIGASIYSKTARERIYRLKERDPSKPLLAVISDLDMLFALGVEILPVFYPLSSEFWPGPLTIVFRWKGQKPEEGGSSEPSLGVRLPNHAWLRGLIRHASFPITASSANLSGEREVSEPRRVIELFSGKVDLIVDGGKTKGGLSSTVVDLRSGKPVILREGAASSAKLKKYL